MLKGEVLPANNDQKRERLKQPPLGTLLPLSISALKPGLVPKCFLVLEDKIKPQH